MRKWLGFMFAVGLWVTPAASEEDCIAKYKNFLPEEIQALSEAEKQQVPMVYLNAAVAATSPLAKEIFGVYLNQLMCPGIGDYDAAIRAFQADLGEEPNGKPTVWQLQQLYFRAGMQGVSQIIVPDTFYSNITDQSALIKGTMIIVDEEIVHPINYQTMRCFRAGGYCSLDEISVELPTEQSWGFSPTIVNTDPIYYEITDWGMHSSKAVFKGAESACRSTSVELNFSTKEFYFITTNLQKDCEVLGTKLERLKKPRISQIVDGEPIIREQYNALHDLKRSFISRDLAKKFDGMSNGKSDLPAQNDQAVIECDPLRYAPSERRVLSVAVEHPRIRPAPRTHLSAGHAAVVGVGAGHRDVVTERQRLRIEPRDAPAAVTDLNQLALRSEAAIGGSGWMVELRGMPGVISRPVRNMNRLVRELDATEDCQRIGLQAISPEPRP